MSFGKILREKRKELGLTLDEVADYTGFSKPYLSTIETGKVNNPPSAALVEGLEKILKFKKGYLQEIAHMERIPAKIRRDFEAIEAENRKYKQLIHNIVNHRVSVAKAGKMISSQDFKIAPPGQTKQSAGRAGHWIPVINKVSAGYPAEFEDLGYPVGYADDYVRAPDLHDPNAFAVRVVGDSMQPRYIQGDIVIFSPAAEVHDGDDCFIRFKEPHETTFKRVFFDQRSKIRLQPRNEKYPPQTVDKKRINGIYRAVIRYEHL